MCPKIAFRKFKMNMPTTIFTPPSPAKVSTYGNTTEPNGKYSKNFYSEIKVIQAHPKQLHSFGYFTKMKYASVPQASQVLHEHPPRQKKLRASLSPSR